MGDRNRVTMQWFAEFQEALIGVEARKDGHALQLEDGLSMLKTALLDTIASKNRVFLIGNGGSAAICAHVAVDWTKFLRLRVETCNDAPMMSMIANDFEWKEVFSRQINARALPGDVLVAISSSGRSGNILKAVEICRQKKMTVHTVSGFERDNPLQHRGRINFWIPSKSYGHVEAATLCLLHSLVNA